MRIPPRSAEDEAVENLDVGVELAGARDLSGEVRGRAGKQDSDSVDDLGVVVGDGPVQHRLGDRAEDDDVVVVVCLGLDDELPVPVEDVRPPTVEQVLTFDAMLERLHVPVAQLGLERLLTRCPLDRVQCRVGEDDLVPEQRPVRAMAR
jgi:hypothetical protein